MRFTIYKSFIINPVDKGIEYIPYGGLCVGADGIIKYYGDYDSVKNSYPDSETIDFSNSILIPGLIDCHSHIFQEPTKGYGTGKLIDWLNNCIMPLETLSNDTDFSQRVSADFFENCIDCGTTTIVAFSTNSRIATCEAFKSANKLKLRAFIGNSLMDETIGDFPISNTIQNITDSYEIKNCWHNHDKSRLRYIVSPRFAVSCSAELLKRASSMAKNDDLLIQTHLSENMDELELVSKKFPDCENYTSVYNQCSLLGGNTLLSHCIHLSDSEIELLVKSRSTIIHCPSSNRFLSSGIMPAREYLNAGLKIALGTDVAAGWSNSILNEMREAIETSKTYSYLFPQKELLPLTVTEVFKSGTINAAEYLGISDLTGNFKEGKEADLSVFHSKQILSSSKTNEEILSKLIYMFSNRSASEVFVRGNKINQVRNER